MLHELSHILAHTIEDNVFLILFLFLTYLVMEYLEHKAGGHANELIKKAVSAGPIIGAVLLQLHPIFIPVVLSAWVP